MEARLPLLHICKTAEGLQVGSNVTMYLSLPKYWYYGPSDHVYVQTSNWKEIDVSFPGEEPKLIKVGLHLEGNKLKGYRSLIKEYRDVFV